MANSRAAGAPRHAPRRRSRRIHHSRTSTRTSDSQCDLCRHQFVFHRPTAVPTVSRPHPLSRSIQPLLLAGVRSFHSQICLQEFSYRGFWLQTIERLSGFRSRSTVDCGRSIPGGPTDPLIRLIREPGSTWHAPGRPLAPAAAAGRPKYRHGSSRPTGHSENHARAVVVVVRVTGAARALPAAAGTPASPSLATCVATRPR
jgi:hypothetical protein